MKIKGIEDNSIVREIGSIYRRRNGSDWCINIKLQPGQKKQSLSISQLPILARRRVLNAREEPKPAGYQMILTVTDASGWLHQKISDCPIPSVANQEDKDQWCFTFQDNGTTFYLSQLELARTLFFHHSYICRLALIPGGLNEEFDIQPINELGRVQVNILPTSTLPLYVRGDYELRRVLAWLLLDRDARKSFDSIANYQLTEGEETNKHRVWRFRFAPPALSQVKLTVRGHFDSARDAFFVYEIYGVENLPCNSAVMVDFFDPRFVQQGTGKGVEVERYTQNPMDPLIDEGESPLPEPKEQILNSSSVRFSFSVPVHTTRIGPGKRRPMASAKETGKEQEPDAGQNEVSTDEATILGQLPAAGFDTANDQSDDLHLYTHKFEAFSAMVEQLKAKGCKSIRSALRKLPAVKGYSKHLLEDGNPRCLSFHLLSKEDQNYGLLEVDTSDNKNRLSTLLLKQPKSPFDWESELSELEQRLLQKSLCWPTAYLSDEFTDCYSRISHPKTSSSNKAYLEPNSVQHWADRVYAEMQ